MRSGRQDYRLITFAATCVVFGTALRAWCWKYLYEPTPEPVTFTRAWRILLIGQLLNIGVPAPGRRCGSRLLTG